MRTVLIFSILFFVSAQFVSAKKNHQLDSLVQRLEQHDRLDSNRVDLLVEVSKQVYRSAPLEGMKYADEAKKLAEQLGYQKGMQEALFCIGACYYYKGIYGHSLENFLESLHIAESRGDRKRIGDATNAIGVIYMSQDKKDKALEAYLKALEMAEGEKDKLSKMNNIATLYTRKGELTKAMSYMTEALELAKKHNEKYREGLYTHNLSDIYFRKKDYKTAYKLVMEARVIFDSLKQSVTENHYYEGKNLLKLGKRDGAEKAFWTGISKAKKAGALADELEGYELLHGFYKQTKNYKKSLENYERYLSLKDSIYNEEKSRLVEELQTKYGLESAEKENELQRQELELKETQLDRQKLLRNSILGALLFMVIGVIVLYINIKQKKKTNLQLEHQKSELFEKGQELLTQAEEMKQLNEEIQAQRDYVEEKNLTLVQRNKIITDSIEAASVIQQGLLPFSNRLGDNFRDFFTIYQPKDIVSGDFYWLSHKHKVLAVVDCTGHGVSGAFMSTLAYSMLGEVVDVLGKLDPAEILRNMDSRINMALNAAGDSNHEGAMDIVVCVFGEEENGVINVDFAGAKRPLYYWHGGELHKLKGDNSSVGGFKRNKEKLFTTQRISLDKGDTLYLTTDGYVDTPSPNRKRFGTARFENTLKDITVLSMEEQKEILQSELKNHQQDTPHRDDVTVVGVRV
ncbi:SpoIIE family protein phosphatase [Limibacter armeniacum]|uniref:SpoIIE family protein phosphatase n=1 Tax=Limibacter armeniacum TaxID=466084 RepID=UPI002FE6894D